jgi:hypothetical protein
MRTELIPCSVCARHVRVADRSCPFCGAGLSAPAGDRGLRQAPPKGLSRAELYGYREAAKAFAGAALLAAAACDSPPAAAYGGPPPMPPTEVVTPPDAASRDAAMAVQTIYGGPPPTGPVEAGPPPVPAYGAPPPAPPTPPSRKP